MYIRSQDFQLIQNKIHALIRYRSLMQDRNIRYTILPESVIYNYLNGECSFPSFFQGHRRSKGAPGVPVTPLLQAFFLTKQHTTGGENAMMIS